MDAFVTEQLALIAIDDEAICEYVARLVEDNDEEEEERREVISGVLSANTDQPVEDIIDAMFAEWQRRTSQMNEQVDTARQQAYLEARERERQTLRADKPIDHECNTETSSSTDTAKIRSPEELARRELTLARYGYGDGSDNENNDGKQSSNTKSMTSAAAAAAAQAMAHRHRGKGKKGAPYGDHTSDAMFAPNLNRALIDEKERVQRETMRQNHQKKVERDREQLRKQRLDKEKDKEKKQTQKQEKRRM